MTKEEIIAKAKRVIETEQLAITSLLNNLGQEFADAIGLLKDAVEEHCKVCLLYTSPSPRDKRQSRMPSSA